MILVTGGTGMLGCYFLLKLTEQGSVRAIYRSEKKLRDIKNIFKNQNKQHLFSKIQWKRAVLEDKTALEKAFQGVQKVYHVAGLVSFDSKDNQKMMQTNGHGTRNIVALCLQYNVKKLCYIGSVAVLKNKKSWVREQDLIEPNKVTCGYALSKYRAMQEVQKGIEKGLKAVILNPSVILGGYFWKENTGLFFDKIHKGLWFYPLKITGFIGATDVVRFACQLMESPIHNEEIILNAENKKVQCVLNRIAKKLDKKPPFIPLYSWMAEIIWRVDFLLASLLNYRQRFTKKMAESIHIQNFYNNQKAKAILDFSFTPIEKVIDKLALEYEKTHSK